MNAVLQPKTVVALALLLAPWGLVACSADQAADSAQEGSGGHPATTYGAGGAGGSSAATSHGTGGAGGSNVECESLSSPHADPVNLHFVNAGAGKVTIVDGCAEAFTQGIDGVEVDGTSLGTFANCDDMLSPGDDVCQLGCELRDDFPIAPGATLVFPWNGKLELRNEGSPSFTKLPSACYGHPCAFELECIPLVVVGPGHHTLTVHYVREGNPRTLTKTLTFALPASDVTIELP